jgi:hypothetical protein
MGPPMSKDGANLISVSRTVFKSVGGFRGIIVGVKRRCLLVIATFHTSECESLLEQDLTSCIE